MAAHQIPPIQCLLTFEAVERRLSVRKAAEELCLTPGEISHRIRELEAQLCCRLVCRADFTLSDDGGGRPGAGAQRPRGLGAHAGRHPGQGPNAPGRGPGASAPCCTVAARAGGWCLCPAAPWRRRTGTSSAGGRAWSSAGNAPRAPTGWNTAWSDTAQRHGTRQVFSNGRRTTFMSRRPHLPRVRGNS
jgi:hypothetical protein